MNTLHCSTILDSVARYADRQLAASLKARTKDPAEGSSPGAAFTGPLRRGSGGSNGTIVAAGEKSSGSLSHAIITRFTLLQNSLRQSAYAIYFREIYIHTAIFLSIYISNTSKFNITFIPLKFLFHIISNFLPLRLQAGLRRLLFRFFVS
ncbi:hypothetical protein MA16_Dca028620 [Dendrobium catenatum]|uniref:Uncharacterized protein n=1 Tax=Dendrobium catenatum TaxID=906689 RepID=A0A2I0VC59_9ASPA|nr:hypothetical protein MA16_Dca028620 [Dendrobium catenatum]